MFKRCYLLLSLLFFNSIAYAEVADDYSYSYASIDNKCGVYDPYENLNRKIFFFNSVLDRAIFRPIAKAYGTVTNDYSRARVNSFLLNMKEPLSTVNYSIQGNSEGALKTFWRFVLNSTLGVAGMFDIASKFGLEAKPQNFSNTLAYYGVGAGPYVVLPILGGYSARDAGSFVAFDYFTSPMTYLTNDNVKIAEFGANVVHFRHKNIPFTDYVENHSLDPYIAIRNAILNERESKMQYPNSYRCR